MPFALILMIKNEERILRRCLKSVENLVDYFCITDTGSTDTSVAIAEEFLQTHKGKVFNNEWKNFGHNRSLSFLNTQEYLRSLNCDLTSIYGVLIDADMVFNEQTLKKQKLSAIGYRCIQVNGNLEYYNTRLVRMDFSWKCVGVTHEYWDGETENMYKDVCYIQDNNDGGCKSDKFQRDERLLLKGLEDEPKNVRYMFYLAQTYKCLSKWEDAIAMYKNRIAAGGWAEEIWYSHYMIGDCYNTLNNIPLFECWMQLAHKNRPHRSESIYKLAEYYRIISQHYKSYEYIKIGKSILFPKQDTLFIEANVYNALFEYEQSIVEFYIHPERCLQTTINFMLKNNAYQQNCLSNLKFSIKPIPSKIEKLELPLPFGDNFRPSAISLHTYPLANVRFVNYWIENGDYKTKDSETVQTENAYINLETNEVIRKMNDSSIVLPRFTTNVKGLEDIRLFENNDTLQFTAVSVKEYQEHLVRVITGEYSLDGDYKNVRVLESPMNNPCEKNWLPIANTNTFIYGWYPFQIVDDKHTILKTINTPPLFSLFRGSANPIQYENEWMSLIHFVEYSKPRKYYHCFVRHDSSMIPKQISLPFCFKDTPIEYCVSFRAVDNCLECYVSFMDKDPHKITISIKSLEWISI